MNPLHSCKLSLRVKKEAQLRWTGWRAHGPHSAARHARRFILCWALLLWWTLPKRLKSSCGIFFSSYGYTTDPKNGPRKLTEKQEAAKVSMNYKLMTLTCPLWKILSILNINFYHRQSKRTVELWLQRHTKYQKTCLIENNCHWPDTFLFSKSPWR